MDGAPSPLFSFFWAGDTQVVCADACMSVVQCAFRCAPCAAFWQSQRNRFSSMLGLGDDVEHPHQFPRNQLDHEAPAPRPAWGPAQVVLMMAWTPGEMGHVSCSPPLKLPVSGVLGATQGTGFTKFASLVFCLCRFRDPILEYFWLWFWSCN